MNSNHAIQQLRNVIRRHHQAIPAFFRGKSLPPIIGFSCGSCISWLKFPASAFSLADSAHQRKLAVKISVVPAFPRGKNGSVSSVASCSIRVSPSSLSSVFISVHLWLTKMAPFARLPPVQSLFVWFEYFVVKGLRMPSFVIRHSSFAFS